VGVGDARASREMKELQPGEWTLHPTARLESSFEQRRQLQVPEIEELPEGAEQRRESQSRPGYVAQQLVTEQLRRRSSGRCQLRQLFEQLLHRSSATESDK